MVKFWAKKGALYVGDYGKFFLCCEIFENVSCWKEGEISIRPEDAICLPCLSLVFFLKWEQPGDRLFLLTFDLSQRGEEGGGVWRPKPRTNLHCFAIYFTSDWPFNLYLHSEVATPGGLLHPLLLPRIYPPLFTLYALYNEKEDSNYWKRINHWNKQTDMGLMSSLGVDQWVV